MAQINNPPPPSNSTWFPKIVAVLFAILTLSVILGSTKTDRRYSKKLPSGVMPTKKWDIPEENIEVDDGALKIKKIARLPPSEIQTNGTIVERTSLDGISYYHCSAAPGHSPLDVFDIMLLHGAKFTKEDWKESGILERLCKYKRVNVLTVDLPVESTFESLVPLIEGLASQKVLTKLPLAALITPSASGKTIVTAIESGTVDSIAVVTRLWIPIACQVFSLTETDLKKVKDASLLSIWSMYGDQDEMGQKSSLKLQSEAGAEVSEFQGEHAFYLSIPDEFTDAVIKKLEVPT